MTQDLVATDGLAFAQKRLSNRAWLTFRDDELDYRFEDASHARRFRVPYRELPFTHAEHTDKFEALRGLTFVWLFIAGLNALRALADPAFGVAAVVVLALAGLSWLGYRRFSATFTVIDAEQGRLLILHDGQEERVMAELAQRRRDALLAEYGEVDHGTDPDQERAKFAWLRDRGVLTEDEYQEKLAEIGGQAPGLPGGPGGPGGGTVH